MPLEIKSVVPTKPKPSAAPPAGYVYVWDLELQDWLLVKASRTFLKAWAEWEFKKIREENPDLKNEEIGEIIKESIDRAYVFCPGDLAKEKENNEIGVVSKLSPSGILVDFDDGEKTVPIEELERVEDKEGISDLSIKRKEIVRKASYLDKRGAVVSFLNYLLDKVDFKGSLEKEEVEHKDFEGLLLTGKSIKKNGIKGMIKYVAGSKMKIKWADGNEGIYWKQEIPEIFTESKAYSEE